MFVTYVLYSGNYNKIYIGFTSNLPERLLSHNVYATKGFTIKYRPRDVIYKEEYSSKTEAMKREKELKSAKGREFIKTLIKKI